LVDASKNKKIRLEKYAVNSQDNSRRIFQSVDARNAACTQGVDAGNSGVDAGIKPGISYWTVHTSDANTDGMQPACDRKQAAYHRMQRAYDRMQDAYDRMHAACSLQCIQV
jgi:hypothetical protein